MFKLSYFFFGINISSNLGVPDSNRSSAVSDLSSSEDEAPIVSECETQGLFLYGL